MHHLRKVFRIYGSTGGMLLVLIILTGSIFYVIFGPQPQDEATRADVKVAQITTNNEVQVQSGPNCNANGFLDSEEQNFLNLLNQYRASRGLSTLTVSTKLSEMAQWYADDAAAHNLPVNHVDSLGRDVSTNGGANAQRSIDCGITSFSGEILTWGPTGAQQAMNAYKNSAEHNAIMLQSNNVQVGIGKGYNPNSTYKYYWVVEFNSANDGTNGGGTEPPTQPPVGEPPRECVCTGGWIMLNGEVQYNFTGQCGQKYTDPEGADWACTDAPFDRGWQKIQPGMCMNGHIIDATTGKFITWYYLGPNDKGVCGTDKKEYWCTNGNWIATGKTCGPGSYTPPSTNPPPGVPPVSTKTCDQLYQARGYQSYSQFCSTIGATACNAGNSTGSCQCTPNCSGGTQPPNNTQYSLNSTTDKNSYKPGETIKLCYTITPNRQFTAVLMESKDNGAPFEVTRWQASGNVNECADLVIDTSSTPGARRFTINALINNQQVATTSRDVTIVGNNPTTAISPSVVPTTGSSVAPTNPQSTVAPTTVPPTPGATVAPTTTPAPGNGNLAFAVKLPGIGSAAVGMNKNPQPATKVFQVKLINPTTDAEINTTSVNLTFDLNSNAFRGSTQIQAGNYHIKIRANNSLWRDAGVVFVASGSTNASAPVVTLATGDLNGDNRLDLADYNIFISCFGTRVCADKQTADVNLDGKVNELDLNIFYSGLANRQGD